MVAFVPHLIFRYLCIIVKWHAFGMRKIEKYEGYKSYHFSCFVLLLLCPEFKSPGGAGV